MKRTMIVLFSGLMLTGLFAVPAAANETAAEAAPGDSENAPEATSFSLFDGVNYTNWMFSTSSNPGCFTLGEPYKRRADSVQTTGTIGLCETDDCHNCLVIAGDRPDLKTYRNRAASIYIYN